MFSGKLTADTFLSEYWQRKPVLIRQGLPDFTDPLSPEELAGLACEAELESRLVFTKPKRYTLQTSPFTEDDFTSLPANNWTLLVQAVDQFIPEVKALLNSVGFLPSWRLDDVMVSYATKGGGVGPHFDYYDVFLIQGQGSRVWRTGQHCSSQDLLRTDSGLKLLSEFRTESEWTLHSGDILYVPPGIAHWGISEDNSLSYSIGFRAPSLADMLLGYSDELADQCTPDQRYQDPPLHPTPLSGEIDQAALASARTSLLSLLQNDTALMQWFGTAVTQPRNPAAIQPRKKLTDSMLQAPSYSLNPASRLAWHRQANTLYVFTDGGCEQFRYSAALAALLQKLAGPGGRIATASFTKSTSCRQLMKHLLLQGTLLPERK